MEAWTHILNMISKADITLWLSWIFIIYGIFILLTSSIGMLRMPDLYTKLHALSISDSMGAPLILIGIAINYGATILALKIVLLAILFLIINPVSSYCLAQAGLYSGAVPKGERK